MMTYKILLICCTTATKTNFLIIAVVSKYILAKSIQCVSRPYFLAWSTEGCQTYPGKLPDTIRCECKHLTNFALLIDVNQSGSNPMSLSIITWIGCGVSIFGLLLTVVTFTVFRCVEAFFVTVITFAVFK